MSILSLKFLLLLAVLLAVHYCLPIRFRWMSLLAASMVFYAASGWKGMVYMAVVTLLTWGAGLYVARNRELEKAALADADLHQNWLCGVRRRRMQVWTVLLVIGGMVFIKYASLIHTMANGIYIALTQSTTPLAPLTLIAPLGLSYFTFQSVGYVVDCARGKAQPERNPLKYLLFVSFFPQMTQGPISTYKQLMPQLMSPAPFEPATFTQGFQLILWGFFKKMVLADRLAYLTDAVKLGENQPGWFIVAGVAIYTIRLYADFSGGMDVVRGAARMLGVDVVDNFRRPFFSTSVAEYWRRWHISLGTWFRSYLFYPLTTSRFGLWLSKVGQKVLGKKTGRMLPGVVATFLIFFLIGVWHKANLNALFYGLYFGLLMSTSMLLENTFKKWRTKLHIDAKAWWWKAVGLVRTWVLIFLPQYFAFTDTTEQAFKLIKGTFGSWNFAGAGQYFTAIAQPLDWYICIGAFVTLLVVDLMCEFGIEVNEKLSRTFFLIRWVALIALLLAILVVGCYGAEFNAGAFLYTQF